MREIICFHNPDEEFGWLSNWYLSDFEADGIRFSSMEQYMMYEKAITFGDFEVAEKVLEIQNVAAIKQYGRQVAHYNDVIWNGIRQLVVYKGLLAKFTQNEELWEKLKKTGSAILAECAVRDRIWGIGLSMHDAACFDMSQWKGQNLLGFALMQVRER
ncbi:MAG: NADAR family protein [Roseburia sp.]